MAHLWVSEGDGWIARALTGSTLHLSARGEAVEISAGDEVPVSGVVLICSPSVGTGAWTLVAEQSKPVFVNGERVALGIRALEDRDEIRLGATRPFYFSTERQACVESFSGGNRIFCARCKLELEEGTRAVRCPACGIWHHQSDELPCWTYSETCTLCPQPTEIGAGFQWSPEGL